jgi:insertion element IS1 protein InsB
VAALPALEDTLLPSQKGDVLELDELWSFVRAKWQTCWLWVALCRRTRQIVAYTLGDRSQESALWLREAIPHAYCRRATRSDQWEAYGAVFPARTHRCCGKKEGQINHAERFFGSLRARLGRVVRRAYSFSKSEERHAEAVQLFIVNYNLAIQQQATTI